ncbi:unnamed protein product [Durusdinium trenchii]|uniref:Uncharacterized protein n=1 Tax=Durusdinium trenchii TaxID=1381693 RepID=A0ABP0LL21_9DINO
MQRSMAELLTLMDCDVTGSDSPSGDFVGDASSLECEHLERVERDVETQIEIQNEQKESKEPAQCLGWRPRSEESPNDSVEVNDVYNLQLREEAECEEEGLRPEQEPEAPSISEEEFVANSASPLEVALDGLAVSWRRRLRRCLSEELLRELEQAESRPRWGQLWAKKKATEEELSLSDISGLLDEPDVLKEWPVPEGEVAELLAELAKGGSVDPGDYWASSCLGFGRLAG